MLPPNTSMLQFDVFHIDYLLTFFLFFSYIALNRFITVNGYFISFSIFSYLRSRSISVFIYFCKAHYQASLLAILTFLSLDSFTLITAYVLVSYDFSNNDRVLTFCESIWRVSMRLSLMICYYRIQNHL